MHLNCKCSCFRQIRFWADRVKLDAKIAKTTEVRSGRSAAENNNLSLMIGIGGANEPQLMDDTAQVLTCDNGNKKAKHDVRDNQPVDVWKCSTVRKMLRTV
ncbi:Hypothetical protein NTJ_10763 [Nesidiocoris tenuis]|uniref:Uncharacterized protein n=1 Tax=Nesidiocoris tenuis TaxID=355587 RepID=A0ABN7B0K2_9HEMI|nr:Hypothetical protein NTJ_10763 [Nesidiocoris tenuis]